MTRPSPSQSRAEAPARVFLASRSPRRRAMLLDYGVEHEAGHPGFDDGVLAPGDVDPEQWVASLAFLKASSGAEQVLAQDGRTPHLVIGADTACLAGARLVGTPEDASEAREILRLLRRGEHDVLTGVALVWVREGRMEERQLFVDRATVRMGDLSDDQVEEYVESGAWSGKAGAYNLAERLEAGWPIEYVGDPTTIMGLPMGKLVPRLVRMGLGGGGKRTS